ncbi:hypothetical protein [Micromonospora sp. NPDC049204]|uniref:phage tail protein n=1 Tax=Micromonospora sp. NPDC049204 TaxID=3154351 RepID=UPI00340C5760
MSVLRAAYVPVEPQTDRFEPMLRAKLRRIDVSKEGSRVGGTFAKGFSDRGGAFATAAATIAARATLMGSAVASAAPAVAQLGAALAPAAGALVAMPAAMVAVKVAAGTLKLATAGVSEAIQTGITGSAKEAAKAMEGLPAGAATFARSIIGLKGKLNDLRSSVSNSFFAGINEEIGVLGKVYLPAVSRQLPKIAASLGGFAENFLRAANQGPLLAGLNATLAGTARGLAVANDAVRPLTDAFGNLLLTGAPMLQRLGTGFRNVATDAAGFVNEAAKTGQLRAWLQGGLDTLRTLGGVVANVGSIFGSVFSAATSGSGNLLTNLQKITGQVAAFLKSAQGSSAMTTLFGTLSTLGESLWRALSAVLPAVAQSVQALLPSLGTLAPVFADLVIAVAPLLPYFAQMAAMVLTALVPAVAALASWLIRNQDAMKVFAVVLGGVLLAVKAFALYANAAAIATTVWSVATKVAAAASKIWTGVQWLLNAALTANPIGLVVVAIGLLVGAVILAYKNSETFRDVVSAAWAGVKIAIAAVGAWFVGTLWPSLKAAFGQLMEVANFLWRNVMQPAWAGISYAIQAAWVVIQVVFAAFKLYLTNVLFPAIQFLYENVVKPVFNAVASRISEVWNNGIKPVLSALGGFISNHVAPAFRTGVSAIAAAWDKLKEAAAAPVRFVVDQVLNKGIIGSINWLASKVGVKDRIPTISWGGAGGSTAKAARTPTGRDNADHLGDGYGRGDGKGIGDGLGSLLTNPAKWLGDRIGLGGIVGKFGSNPFSKMVTGAAGKAKDFALERVRTLAGELLGGSGGGSVGAGGLRSGIAGVLASLRSTFGSVPLISGVRAGARTLSGNVSYHASGRAVDLAPVEAWARYLHDTYGPQLKELITPFPQYNLHNGKPHKYTGAVWNQHNFAGGNAHVHAAMARGGTITEPIFGVGQSGRTYSFGEGGRHESVVPHGPMRGGSVVSELRSLRAEVASAMGGGPLIGSVTLAPSSDSARDQIDELVFALRRIRRGGVYAGP